MAIERDRTDRSCRRCALAQPRLACALRERVVVRETLGARKLQRTFACQHHVACALHHAPGHQNGVAHAPQPRDRAAAQIVAAHDRGIHLDLPFRVEAGAAAGVEKRRILENGYRRGDRVEARAAASQNVVAGLERSLERGSMPRARPVPAHDAGAAVQGERGVLANRGRQCGPKVQ